MPFNYLIEPLSGCLNDFLFSSKKVHYSSVSGK
jgi:hypothetical protein